MKSLLAILTICLGSYAMAESKVYEVKGMHCGGCVKSIKAKVCQLPGVESCSVEIGKVSLTSKTDTQLDDKAIAEAVKSAGEYEIKKVEVKK